MASKEHVGIQQQMASRHLNGEIKSFLLIDAQLSFNSDIKLILLGLLQQSSITFFPQSISSPKVSLAGYKRNCCQLLCQDAWPPRMAFTSGSDPHKNMGSYKGGEEAFITQELTNVCKRQI